MKKYVAVAVLTVAVLVAFGCSQLQVAQERLDYYDGQITALGAEIAGIAGDFEALYQDAKTALESLETLPTPEQIAPYYDRYTALKGRFVQWLEHAGSVWKEAKAEFGRGGILDRLVSLAESESAQKAVGYLLQIYGMLK